MSCNLQAPLVSHGNVTAFAMYHSDGCLSGFAWLAYLTCTYHKSQHLPPIQSFHTITCMFCAVYHTALQIGCGLQCIVELCTTAGICYTLSHVVSSTCGAQAITCVMLCINTLSPKSCLARFTLACRPQPNPAV